MRSLYKIIHTSSRAVWGDTENRILRESLWMENQGHQVVIIAPDKSPLFLNAREKGIIVYPLSFQPLAQLGEYRRIKQIFTNENPFVVNCHGRADARIALKAAQKTGVDCRIMSRHTGSRLKNTWANRRLYKKLCHYVFTTAGDTTRHLQGLFGLSDMEIFSIPDGITEPDALMPQNEARKKLAHTFGLGAETRFIGCDGNLPGHTSIKLILSGFKKVSSAFAHHLVFSGKLPEASRKEIAMLASAMDIREKIHFYTEEKGTPWVFHRALDCAVQISGTSIYQGIPLEMIKAMYCNCPVIGSDTPGIRDLLIHEKTGLVFDPESDDALPQMIRLTLEQNPAVLERADAAKQKVQKYNTIDAMGRDIIRIYRLHQVKIERRFYPN